MSKLISALLSWYFESCNKSLHENVHKLVPFFRYFYTIFKWILFIYKGMVKLSDGNVSVAKVKIKNNTSGRNPRVQTKPHHNDLIWLRDSFLMSFKHIIFF